jgi:putative transcriptional regulator
VSYDSLKGRLLIATPSLLDPNFRRTVVLLLEHTADGAIGVVLNRPSDTEAREAVPDLRAVLLDDEPIFLGGPVQPDTVIALADHTDPLDADDDPICGSIASLEFDDDPDRLQASVSRARVFAGYAGWDSGQLEGEIEEQAWFTEEALPGDVFCSDPVHLWSHVLERMGSQYRLLARMPDDPRMN